MATLRGNLAEARLREKDRMRGDFELIIGTQYEEPMMEPPIRLGAAGLGRAFMLMLPAFTLDRRVVLAGAADRRPEARLRFTGEFGAPSYATVEELCKDRSIEAVYIATPHQFHAEHVRIAAAHGKHILVEKAMAVTMQECTAMIATAKEAGVALIVGHSHSFDAPIQKTRQLIGSGAFGGVRAITAMNFTDFLYRPRRREELVTAEGGGVIFNQAAHQIDIIRLLGGGLLSSVRAETGAWDSARPTEGAYSALLTFESGLFASAAYSGYAHFDSDEFCGWIGELGQAKMPDQYGAARRDLGRSADPDEEEAMKAKRTYGRAGGPRMPAGPPAHQHFGFILVTCQHADLRPMPQGVMIYGDADQRLDVLPPVSVPRSEVVDELVAVVRAGKPAIHSGEWGRATLEACLAILQSARERKDVHLFHQVGLA
jgi:phthalate 4,5-cis-dihydrodiol dehydrogenase